MKSFLTVLLLILTSSIASGDSLLTERGDYKTVLKTKVSSTEPLEKPPEGLFEVVKYDTELGKMSAYLFRDDRIVDQKGAAIIWLTGGLPCSSPGNYLWTEPDIENEQSARVYRLNGITMMYPTLRGGVLGNPGLEEQFFGEVNDVISAGNYLRSLENVDPNQVYLGGHSTGGTLALLVAASTDIFAGVISLGPTSSTVNYGIQSANYEWTAKEIRLRSPKHFLHHIKIPTYVIEGELEAHSSLEDLRSRNQLQPNSKLKIITVAGGDHFNLIHPVNSIFAKAILESKNGSLSINIEKELEPAYKEYARKRQESIDLEILSDLRMDGVEIDGERVIESVFYAKQVDDFKSLIADAEARGIKASPVLELMNEETGVKYYTCTLSKSLEVNSLREIFNLSSSFRNIAEKNQFYYDYWTIRDDAEIPASIPVTH